MAEIRRYGDTIRDPGNLLYDRDLQVGWRTSDRQELEVSVLPIRRDILRVTISLHGGNWLVDLPLELFRNRYTRLLLANSC